MNFKKKCKTSLQVQNFFICHMYNTEYHKTLKKGKDIQVYELKDLILF